MNPVGIFLLIPKVSFSITIFTIVVYYFVKRRILIKKDWLVYEEKNGRMKRWKAVNFASLVHPETIELKYYLKPMQEHTYYIKLRKKSGVIPEYTYKGKALEPAYIEKDQYYIYALKEA